MAKKVMRSVKKFYNGHPYQLSDPPSQEPDEKKPELRNRIFLRKKEEEPEKCKDPVPETQPDPQPIILICNDMTTQTIEPTTMTQGTCVEPEPPITPSCSTEEYTQTTQYDDSCEMPCHPPEIQTKLERKEPEGKFIAVGSENSKFKQCVLQKVKSRSDENEWEYVIWCTHDSVTDEFEKPRHDTAYQKCNLRRQTSDDEFDIRNTGQTSESHLECIGNEECNITEVDSSSSDSLPCVCSFQEESSTASARRNNSSKDTV